MPHGFGQTVIWHGSILLPQSESRNPKAIRQKAEQQKVCRPGSQWTGAFHEEITLHAKIHAGFRFCVIHRNILWGVQMGGRKMRQLWQWSRVGSLRIVVMAALIGIALMALNPATAEAETWYGEIIRAIGEALARVARTE